ncbi:hypothetical protein T069G_04406 [Trichoderma breve]|uniref:Efflux pump antibiotic resistance protein n=1 Tax=Trichoderma breve TaxID=2034170 RepID=A0A9W9EB77_9HYPO|nr:hypothetical protein T069G_04406 [Trichoderma breve]KAJ4863452.1 hypothetical protein T069G_04406 [Trichoderma breve]
MCDKEEFNNNHAGKGLLVIHVALFRMATRSLAEAYRTLGYKTHHGVEDILGNPWDKIEQAAEATWPTVPNARPRSRFTRSDWDNLWGNEYDIVTDLACPFADQLIQAYPDAKVVIVQRDFDRQQIFVFLIGSVIGSRAAEAMLKVNYGFFKATSVSEIREHAREVYDEYYGQIRAVIPEAKRLEYTMGDGWEPLCAFLGKDVPDIPFPRLNDSKSRSESQRQGEIMVLLNSVKKVTLLGLGVATIAGSLRYFAQA